mgnify:CR=1 FL=1
MLFLTILAALFLIVWAYIDLNPQFGGKLSSGLRKRYARSPQWTGKIFENQSITSMDIGFSAIVDVLQQQFSNKAVRSPQQPLPVIPFDADAFNTDPTKPKFIWYGHSVLLLQLNGKNLLIDPMLGPNAAPISPFPVKRFSENTLDIIDQLPHIDMILMTHDHYDHLDYASINLLKDKVDTWFVALGVSRHLEAWDIPSATITEFDWWHSKEFQGIDITFTPSRHFSGRGLTDRSKCLWGGWVFKTNSHSIYWSGDSGYDEHFKEVNEQLGPFDWGFMECGQYNEYWHEIHMYPEEAVQASVDTGVKVSIPVHWGGFPLALHTWKDPIERFAAEAKEQKQAISTPKIGQVVVLGEEPTEVWWANLK